MQRLQLQTRDVMRRRVIKLEPTQTLYDARNLMLRYRISRIVVASGPKATGIVTEKDMVRFLYTGTVSRKLSEIRLDEVMTRDPVTVDEESSIKSAAGLMLEKEISSVLVSGDDGNLTGILTKSDLTSVYANYYVGRNSADDYMTRHIFTVAPDESAHSALLLISGRHISRVVVARDRKAVGIITGRDLLPISTLLEADTYKVLGKASLYQRADGPPVFSGVSSVMLARDVMRHDPITITSGSDLADAAQIMFANRISGLPVVDSNDDLVGIVTRTDIARALAST